MSVILQFKEMPHGGVLFNWKFKMLQKYDVHILFYFHPL